MSPRRRRVEDEILEREVDIVDRMIDSIFGDRPVHYKPSPFRVPIDFFDMEGDILYDKSIAKSLRKCTLCGIHKDSDLFTIKEDICDACYNQKEDESADQKFELMRIKKET